MVISLEMFKQATADDDPAGKRWINSGLIGLAWKMKNIKAETDSLAFYWSLPLYHDSLFLMFMHK